MQYVYRVIVRKPNCLIERTSGVHYTPKLNQILWDYAMQPTISLQGKNGNLALYKIGDIPTILCIVM